MMRMRSTVHHPLVVLALCCAMVFSASAALSACGQDEELEVDAASVMIYEGGNETPEEILVLGEIQSPRQSIELARSY